MARSLRSPAWAWTTKSPWPYRTGHRADPTARPHRDARSAVRRPTDSRLRQAAGCAGCRARRWRLAVILDGQEQFTHRGSEGVGEPLASERRPDPGVGPIARGELERAEVSRGPADGAPSYAIHALDAVVLRPIARPGKAVVEAGRQQARRVAQHVQRDALAGPRLTRIAGQVRGRSPAAHRRGSGTGRDDGWTCPAASGADSCRCPASTPATAGACASRSMP